MPISAAAGAGGERQQRDGEQRRGRRLLNRRSRIGRSLNTGPGEKMRAARRPERRSFPAGTSPNIIGDDERAPPARARPPLGDAHLRRPLRRPPLQRALPRATSPRARPASRSPSTCRPRPATTPTTSSPAARSARSASRSPTRATCTSCFDGIPLDEMNTSMTINATAAWLLGLYVTVAEENGVDALAAQGHDPERHHQGVPLARHLRLPARALDAADRRHGRLHASTRCRAGTRPTSAATTCRRPGRRRCRRSPTRSRPGSPCSTR